jgi:hypothetical protein
LSINPYAPPKAHVADVAPLAVAATPAFFPVSRRKLLVMSTLTLTLYQLVWFYKNWALVRARGERVLPPLRAIFAVFFVYGLFDRVRRRSDSAARLDAGGLAAAWILLTVVGNLLDRFVGSEPAVGVFAMSALIGLASVLPLLPVQAAINTINRAEAPDHDPNDRFTGWNWLWIVVGVLLLAATLFGLIAEDP